MPWTTTSGMLVAAVAVMLIGSDTTVADSRAGIDALLRSDALVPEADWVRAETDDLDYSDQEAELYRPKLGSLPTGESEQEPAGAVLVEDQSRPMSEVAVEGLTRALVGFCEGKAKNSWKSLCRQLNQVRQ